MAAPRPASSATSPTRAGWSRASGARRRWSDRKGTRKEGKKIRRKEAKKRRLPLLLFANPPEKDQPKPDDINVLYFGPGAHQAGRIELKSNQTLCIAGGAVVKGGVDATGENIRICGRGILDGGDYARFKGPTKYPVSLVNCTNAIVEGIIIRDSWCWTLVPSGCDGVRISNVKLVASRCENSDGIDIVNCTRVVVEDSFVRTDDDCISPKGMNRGDGRAVEDMLVTRCVLWTDRAHIWRFGAECQAKAMRNIVSKDIDVLHFQDAWFGDGPMVVTLQPAEEMPMENITFENIRINGEGQKILLEVRPQVTRWAKLQTPGMVRNCLFKDIVFTGDSKGVVGAIVVSGPDAVHSVENVRFENIMRYGMPIIKDSPEVHVTGHTSGIVFVGAPSGTAGDR